MADKISLRLMKTSGYEVICDQDGRSLGGVLSFSYSWTLDDGPVMEIKVRAPESKWDDAIDREIIRKCLLSE